MDLGVWALWYDLDDGDRAPFLDWLHQTYLPGLAATRRFQWVAHYERYQGKDLVRPWMRQDDAHPPKTKEKIGSGSRYVMMVGADTTFAFFNASLPEKEEALVANSASMLAKRRGVRHEIFTEEARVGGPESQNKPLGTGPDGAIQFGSFNMSEDNDALGGQWYAKICLPAMETADGSSRTRKWVGTLGWSRHGILYEFPSITARNQAFQVNKDRKEINGEKIWPIGPYTLHAPGSSIAGVRTYLWESGAT